ncbi:MAG TPA: sucrase ferredoxin [Candidatus Limnocylindria bacterium]|nr:sucrase ferredoxin [Candidatus Limnocylindria bacterium]
MTLRAPIRCSAIAEELDEPLAGTVDHRPRWLLVEDRSAWGERAVEDVLGVPFARAAKAAGVQVVLVRRREAPPSADDLRRVMLVDTPERRAAVRVVRDLAWLTLDLVTAPVDAFGEVSDAPTFLVCTNGKRDACCALRGRALLAALTEGHREAVWECTHLGGHRFAANLVCLPDGLVYGRVRPDDGRRLADACLRGEVDLEHLRGRSAFPPPAQVAEVELRRRLALRGVDAVALVACDVSGDRAEVVLAVGAEEHRLQLRSVALEPPRLVSCRADELEAPMHWRVALPSADR